MKYLIALWVISANSYKEKTRQSNPLGIVQEIKIWNADKWYEYEQESVLKNETGKFSRILRYKCIIKYLLEDPSIIS